MNKQFWLTAVALLGSFVLIPCSDYPDPDYSYYNFFEQENINDFTLYRFLRTSGDYYKPKTQTAEVADENLLEWKKYWGNAPTEEDVRALVYGSSLEEMKKIQKGIKKPDALAGWGNNTAVQYCAKNKETASLAYLVFANECEPHLQEPEMDWETFSYKPRNPAPMLVLAKKADKAYKKEKNIDLKMRYAFQIVRLYHYAGEYDKAIAAFDTYVESLGNKNYMYYRALEQKAGALNQKGDPQAAYLFSIVFDKVPSRRDVCLRSFQFTVFMDWEKSLGMCKDEKEQMVFYAMRGLSLAGFPVAEMENIAKTDPNSPYLELLLARQVNECERQAFGMYSEFEPIAPLETDPDLLRTQTLALQLAGNTSVKNRDFWVITAGYLSLFMKKPADCRAMLAKIPSSSKQFQQAQLLDFVAEMMSLTSVDEKIESKLLLTYKNNPAISKHPHARALMMDVLGDLYLGQKQTAKAYLCHNSVVSLSNNLNVELIDALLELVQKPNPTEFERFLMDNGAANASSVNDLLQMRGTYYLERGDYAKALGAFLKLPEDYRKSNPHFRKPDYMNKTIFSYTQMELWFSTDIALQIKEAFYTKHSFLDKDFDKISLTQTLEYLETQAQKQPDKAAEYYFILGCAWMNMTAYGWHRPVLSYYNDNYAYSGWWKKGSKEPTFTSLKNFGWNEFHYYNPKKILEYFDKAYAAATDPEMKAKITFAAAKVEQHSYYAAADELYWDEDYSNDYNIDRTAFTADRPDHQKYFARLKNEFPKTKFYNEVISECTYFAIYAN